MGFMLKKLRERLRKKQEKANAVKNFKKIPRKFISFLPGTSSPDQITQFVNDKMVALIISVGGEDKFVEGDFSVEYVDRTSAIDYIQTHEHTLEANEARGNTSGYGSDSSEQDWESKSVDITTELVDGTDITTMQFYMIIIEYTEIKEIN